MMKTSTLATACIALGLFTVSASAQVAPEPPIPPSPVYGENVRTSPDPVERLGDGLFRVGNIRVDTNKREATVTGRVNPASVLEFIASTKGGFKGYESAFELDTDALTFNVAMILIGLDKENAEVSQFHFDPNPPKGDPVEIWVEWEQLGTKRRIRAEQMLYDVEKKERFPESDWVYTGSVVLEDGRYLAELDGVIIGFVHTPAPIIESPLPNGVRRFGFIQIDPSLNLTPLTPITITVRAVDKK